MEEYPDYGLKLAFLESNDFHLEVIEKVNSFKATEVLSDEKKYLSGIFKVGFKTKNIEELYKCLKKIEGLEFVSNIGELPEN